VDATPDPPDDDGHSIGPYRFSLVDSRRTVAEAVALVDEHALDSPVRAAAIADRRAVVERLVGPVDAWRAPARQVDEVLRSLWPELVALRDDLAAAGELPVRATGSVASVHRGSGGVPKPSVGSVDVGADGVIGDRQATRRHHGAPWQALCLWSVEVIDRLVAGGHPIGPGFAGENVTIGGLDWADVRPGVVMRIGTVVCRMSSFAVPCKQNARWFSDGDFGRIHHRHGAVSRIYATVLEPGRIVVDDDVVLEP
jgi:hypothetical protein